MPVAGGTAENLTSGNAAADGFPRFSPDGKWLAYRAQKQPGFEADRWELMLHASRRRRSPSSVTGKFDRSVEDFVWVERQ